MEARYGSMVQEYFIARLRERAAARRAGLATIRSAADVRCVQADVRAKLARSFGPLPERTPLRARTTGRLERDAYIIEKVIYESRPDYPVTANLYIPRGHGAGPFPCVLATCGHSGVGKAEPNYQAFVQTLARLGFVVLIYDPVSQGERLQYPTREGAAQPQGCCQEHNMMGNQMRLVGDAFCAWRLWDGLRSLDYLLSRDEVNPSIVGLTGNSGGGTLSTYLTAFDDRFTMAAPSCFVTTYLSNLENELPADSEQIPPRMLEYGLDMAEFFLAYAPRPTLLMGQRNDFFDTRGLLQTWEELRRLYDLLDAGNDLQVFIGPRDHGYFTENRQAMYRFFCQHARVEAPTGEPEPRIETPADLAATPGGQVHLLAGTRRVFDFTRERARELAQRAWPVAPEALPRLVGSVLNLPARAGAPHYRVLRGVATLADGRQHNRYGLETELGIVATLHAFAAKGLGHLPPATESTLYLPHLSTAQDAAAGEVPPGDLVFALDARGLGESLPLSCSIGSFFDSYGTDYFYASHGEMLGESYCGRRVHDVLAALDLLAANGRQRVHLVGRGLGAVLAVLAATVHPVVGSLTLRHGLLSVHELTQVPVQSWPLSSLPARVLHHFDLPDCLRLLAARGVAVKLEAPWTSQMAPWENAALTAHLASLGLSDLPLAPPAGKGT